MGDSACALRLLDIAGFKPLNRFYLLLTSLLFITLHCLCYGYQLYLFTYILLCFFIFYRTYVAYHLITHHHHIHRLDSTSLIYCPFFTCISTVLLSSLVLLLSSPFFLTPFSTSTDSSKGDEVTDLYLVHSNMAILNLVSQVWYALIQCHL